MLFTVEDGDLREFLCSKRCLFVTYAAITNLAGDVGAHFTLKVAGVGVSVDHDDNVFSLSHFCSHFGGSTLALIASTAIW